MKRLVYSPYVRAFVKADEGVIDLSPYITSGSVNRKVNQVSSASLVLRNPAMTGSATPQGTVPLLWTDGAKDGGPLLHPMDPIVIMMTRIATHEVQVFTGYCDKTPYLAFYPGLCKIEASCTLKRLLYTQWDAALIWTRNFLAEFGWEMNSNSGILNPNGEGVNAVNGYAGHLKGQFTDGSIGALLFAVLNVIGEWDGRNIWIEALPPQVKTIVENLYNQIQADVNATEGGVTGLITQILGGGSYGGSLNTPTSGGGTVGSPLLNANQRTFASVVSQSTGLDPNVVAAWVIAEEPASSAQAPNGANNWLNIGSFDAGNWASGTSNVWANPTNGGYATASFLLNKTVNGVTSPLKAAAGILAIPATAGKTVQAQIAAIQGSGWATSGYPNLPADYQTILNAGGNTVAAANSGGISLAPASNAGAQAVTGAGTAIRQAAAGATGSTPVFPLTAGTYVGTSSWSNDQGVDIATLSGGCGTQAPLLAIANGTVVGHGIGGFGPDAPILQLDTPLQGYNYVYYGHAGPDLSLPIGTTVKAGQALGSVGCGIVGISTGPHLEIGFCNAQGIPVGSSTSPTMRSVLLSAQAGQPVPGGATSGAPGSGGNTGQVNPTMAAAFSTAIELPSIFDTAEAQFFTGKRSFMADQPLFPFVEQLAQASMRNFMSMPNGDFLGFFPDYFGLFGRKYYWEIADIEIIDARIDLSDDPLVTHVAVAGDTTQYHNSVDAFDLFNTSGIFDIFSAMATGYISLQSAGAGKSPEPGLIDPKALQTPGSKEAALAFLQKYGARPLVEQVPMIRSPIFELFYAFQKFILLWSKQFQTTIELTFMPELFPGGLIAFPNHHLQVYVEEVVHNFDYTSGFTTTVNISSPSKLDSQTRANVSEGMARKAVLKTIPSIAQAPFHLNG